jgi:hypothetical protein
MPGRCVLSGAVHSRSGLLVVWERVLMQCLSCSLLCVALFARCLLLWVCRHRCPSFLSGTVPSRARWIIAECLEQD